MEVSTSVQISLWRPKLMLFSKGQDSSSGKDSKIKKRDRSLIFQLCVMVIFRVFFFLFFFQTLKLFAKIRTSWGKRVEFFVNTRFHILDSLAGP